LHSCFNLATNFELTTGTYFLLVFRIKRWKNFGLQIISHSKKTIRSFTKLVRAVKFYFLSKVFFLSIVSKYLVSYNWARIPQHTISIVQVRMRATPDRICKTTTALLLWCINVKARITRGNFVDEKASVGSCSSL